MAGRVSDDPDSPSFNCSVYNGSGELLEEQQEGYTSNIEGYHYFDTFRCLIPSDCHTIYIAKDVSYQVNFNNNLVRSGYSGWDMNVFKIGEGNCPVCNSKPLLIDRSPYHRTRDIMSVNTMISGISFIIHHQYLLIVTFLINQLLTT